MEEGVFVFSAILIGRMGVGNEGIWVDDNLGDSYEGNFVRNWEFVDLEGLD